MRIEILIDVKTILGENPLWDVDEQRLYWIDSFGQNVFRCTANGSEVRAWDVPAKIGCMALIEKGTLREKGGAVVALQTGFHFLDFDTGECSLITDPEEALPSTRLNDGKVDRRGRFLCGSMDTLEKAAERLPLPSRSRLVPACIGAANHGFQRAMLEPGRKRFLLRGFVGRRDMGVRLRQSLPAT